MIDIQVSGVCERDIDLLLLEEFVSNPKFFAWFLRKLRLASSNRLRAAARSVTTSTGESDLELTLERDHRVMKVLVENKIDASLQPHQAERYTKRGRAYVAAKVCNRFKTVLVAPRAYRGAMDKFDRRISYEAIRDYLGKALVRDRRASYKLLLLRRAIERGTTGWTLEPDEAATAFWHRYWEVASDSAPQLGMPQPGEKPATSHFVRFKALGLGPGVELIHKMAYGNVDLQFAGQAGRAAEFEKKYGSRLENGMRIAKADKWLVVRMMVRDIQLEKPFEESKVVVRKSLKAASRLLDWYSRWINATWNPPG